MDKERDFEKRAAKGLRKTAADVKDSVKEAKHRVAAGAEKAKRELAGDTMTTTEKAGSVIKETGHKLAAETDKAKREVRDKLRK